MRAHFLSFEGWKGEVAFGGVPGRSTWVETHMQPAQTEKQVNKHQIQNTENRNPFSYQLNHSWGAQTNSIRKARMPERHRKNLKLSRKSVQGEATERAGDRNYSKVRSRARENRKQSIRPYRRLWG